MYNSVVVQLLANIWNIILRGYEYSLLSRFNRAVVKKVKYLCKGSYLIRFITSDRSLVGESLLYGIYCKIIDIATNIIRALRDYIKRLGQGSIIYNTISYLFHDLAQLQATFYIFFIAFGLGIIGNNIIRGFYSGKSYVISLVLILISLLGLNIKDDYKNILQGSYVFKFVESIFTIDEGVNQWW